MSLHCLLSFVGLVWEGGDLGMLTAGFLLACTLTVL